MAVTRFANAVLIMGGFFILQLRDRNAKACPGEWGLFGGRIEEGETPYEAVVRELREELEIDARLAIHMLDIGSWSIFSVEVTPEEWGKHALHEGDAVGIFSAAAIAEMRLNGIATGAVMAYLAQEGMVAA